MRMIDEIMGIDTDEKPCEKCRTPTKVRWNNIPGHYACIGERERKRGPRFTDAAGLRLLDDLEHTYKPMRKLDGKLSGPWWRPPAPEVTDLVRTAGWEFRLPRVPSNGRHVVLDRSGSWPTATSSVRVAHGELTHTPTVERFTGAPGFYKVVPYQWREKHIPHPLSGMLPRDLEETAVWVPHPRAQLLQKLADQGRYPEGFITDSYTSQHPVPLTEWATYVNGLREQSIREFGRESPQYDGVKVAFSQAVTLMKGTKRMGQPRFWKCSVHRADWGFAIEDQGACNLWRWADDIYEVVYRLGRPELGVVEMRNVDELVIPFEALDILTKTRRAGNLAPLRIDPLGIKLGSFKVKAEE
jgi:hypothetical protein